MCEQTVLYGDRKTNDRFPKTKFKISKTFLVIRIALTWHTLTRPPPHPPPPPPFEYGSSFFFFGSFLNTTIIHETAQLRLLSCQSVLFLAKTRPRTQFSSCDRRTNSAVVEQRDRRNGESVHFRFRAEASGGESATPFRPRANNEKIARTSRSFSAS